MKRIILRLEGGLGNQLFQYAFARMVQEKNGGKILIDLHTYKSDKQRNLSLHHFKLNSNISLNAHRGIIKILFFTTRVSARLFQRFLKFVKLDKKARIKLLSNTGIFIQEGPEYFNHLYKTFSPVIYIAGNWMSEHYFREIRKKIKSELEITTSAAANNKKIIENIIKTNSVCVHIRRGDYLDPEVKRKTFVCDFEYYEKAITYLKNELEDPKYFVFSNTPEDIEWIKENYKFSTPVTYVNQNNPDYEDLRLMQNCKHFILSNSTFSWWAAYLSTHSHKKIIAPSRWNTGIWDQSDIYCKDWVLIEV